ncbi:hypothetical protein [Prevotella sp.]|uniref:hypothetical protein n=1 Tax=uncultured Prevotella sp. TaxID=159272 RepID=UPI0026021046|nr:hypothetical protein [uncultured Prevotella sp.]
MKESDSKPYLIGMAIPIRMTCLQTDVAIANIKSTGKNDIVFFNKLLNTSLLNISHYE